ncbi:DAK2 domain-containing protein [Filifactor alocis]|uniref:DAK2 domain-containing protein n=1 Tax=Filifactor alocis TaxID=143361 RepID=UPI0028D8BC1A|nr:DAK2 domain-containing protein [Filifactor alocis]
MNRIEGVLFRSMLVSGANNLKNERDIVDRLNVFPVPDGDTGTNMSLTMNSAITELESVASNELGEISKAVARGSLMGARGNSGVILSQILRGFAQGIEGKDYLQVKDFAVALDSARKVAYKAVIKPVEGTILTVCRETAEAALEMKDMENMEDFLVKLLEATRRSLANTPELLKALKEANVVDSGGRGFLSILEGMVKAYQGNPINADGSTETKQDFEEMMKQDIHAFSGEIKFGYCTEFFLRTYEVDADTFRREIEDMGDSMVVVGDEGIIKIHIHTNDPGVVLQKASAHGALDRIKIENMRLQQEAVLAKRREEMEEDPLAYGIISVAVGKGLADMMRDMNVTTIIEGGQTMNPSTEDFVKAIDKINSDTIFVFPNNSNIIMAANQAKEISDKNVIVIPTKDIPSALVGLMAIDVAATPEENEQNILDAISCVTSAEITYAVRDTTSGDKQIKEGEVIGISGKEILANGAEIEEVTLETIDSLSKDAEIITLFYGEDVTEEQATALMEHVAEKYPDVDVEIYEGGQPLYYYFISVE